MNKVILMGRLTRNPDIAWTRSADSKQYASYTLAVNRRFKRNGEQEADFIPCIAWGAMAEFAEKYMKKGAMFSVIGRLYVRSWDDAEGKNTGQQRLLWRSAISRAARRMQRASLRQRQHSRTSLRRVSRWDWRNRQAFIPLRKAWRMTICRGEEEERKCWILVTTTWIA